MSFPLSPTNNQTAILNGQTYIYSSSNSSWTRIMQYVTATTSLLISGTAVSTSTTTGALQVAGGVGIGSGLFVGANITATNVTLSGTMTNAGETVSGILKVTNATVSSSTITGALQVVGGVGIGGDLYVGGAIYKGGVSIGASNLEVRPASYTTISANTNITLSTTTSYNIINATNAGLSGQLTFPTSPADGTVVKISQVGNTTATFNFVGGTFVPNSFPPLSYGLTIAYIYYAGTTTWYRIQ